MSVDVQFASTTVPLPSAADLTRWAKAALAPAKADFDLTVRIVDEDEGLALNRDYRGGAMPTNVLSFPFAPPRGVELTLLGDVVICAPVVVMEAAAQDKAVLAHYAHLVVHGVLHLQGYDHQDEADASRMESLEVDLLSGLGFDDPYGIAPETGALAKPGPHPGPELRANAESRRRPGREHAQ